MQLAGDHQVIDIHKAAVYRTLHLAVTGQSDDGAISPRGQQAIALRVLALDLFHIGGAIRQMRPQFLHDRKRCQ
ncbi:hypothetical protein D3C81_1892920 [compost metagenome]